VSALHALALSFGVLFALRIALGLAEAPTFPAAAQAVKRALPAGERSAAFGMLFTGSTLGQMVAAPLALGLDTKFGWQMAFVATSALGIAWLPFWLFATRSPAARAVLATAVSDASSNDVPSRARLLATPAALRAVALVCAAAPACSIRPSRTLRRTTSRHARACSRRPPPCAP
jgi:ACS family hexuronate transporter-like MFS transporter